MKRMKDWPRVTSGLLLGPAGAGAAALLTRRGALRGPPLACQPAILLDLEYDATGLVAPWLPIPRRLWHHPAPGRPLPPLLEPSHTQVTRHEPPTQGAWVPTLLLAIPKPHRPGTQWFLRLVSLSVLGWAFVFAAVLWELFAYAFSQCAGCGWPKGAFFFLWGLGILVFGFYLRTSPSRPAVSRLFLGVNILMVSVLSLVIATR
jgi:hypothetical protein